MDDSSDYEDTDAAGSWRPMRTPAPLLARMETVA
jgi:hypothetical protein